MIWIHSWRGRRRESEIRDQTDLAMKKVNVREVVEEERKSPKGKFHKFVKDISIALGRDRKSLDLAKRHPFDLANGPDPEREKVLSLSFARCRIGALSGGLRTWKRPR